MSDVGWGLWGTWEETEACLGKVVGQWQGPDPVERGSIRRWLEPKEFSLRHSHRCEAAKAAGSQIVVAPASMVFTYGVAAYWSPGDLRVSRSTMSRRRYRSPSFSMSLRLATKASPPVWKMTFEEPLYRAMW